MIELEIVEVVEQNGSQIEKPTTIQLPTKAAEITLRKYVDFALLLDGFPVWFLEQAEAPFEERREMLAEWDTARWVEYLELVAQAVDFFSSASTPIFSAVIGTPEGKSLTGHIESCFYQILNGLFGYKPKAIKSFEHNGNEYALPSTRVDAQGNLVVGDNLRMIEAATALQAERVFTTVDEQGNLHLPDAKYHIDIAIVAATCRKIVGRTDKGKPLYEEIPAQSGKWDAFFDNRCLEFSDLTMDKAQDVYFFFIRSSRTYPITGKFATLFKKLRQRRNWKLRHKWRSTQTLGDGTQPSSE